MKFLVDTDICSAYLNGHHKAFHQFILHTGGLCVSTITFGELLVWARRTHAPSQRLQQVDDLLKEVILLSIDEAVARTFGLVRAIMLDAGVSVPTFDLLNAAVALTHNLAMVTHNVRDYRNVSGLTVLDWLGP